LKERDFMVTLKNGYYLSPEENRYIRANLRLEGERIEGVGDGAAGTVYDIEGCRVLPGLIDIHTHGAVGFDTMSASPEETVEWSQFLAKNGVTSFMPTTITASRDEILRALRNLKAASQSPALGATILGVHIEGPYLNVKYKGAHDARYILPPSIKDVKEFGEILGESLIMRLTLAPEMDGAMDLIRYVVGAGGYVSIGHCDAVLETVNEAVGNGANSFTHLFNAMRGIHHREPGTAGAALLCDAYAEVICDGIHIHPEIVRLICCTKGIDRVISITDAMQAAGLHDGLYPFAGGNVHVVDGAARTPGGKLAGSTLLLRNGVANLARFANIPFEKAILTATVNPAKAVGLDGVIGRIEPGKRADLWVVDDRMNIRYTFCRGKKIYDALDLSEASHQES